ncbi:hypothetical protein [Aeromonas veronii]|uniref:hypothetical protein n=1 Tax=Aeromonas veronii TaxID=654 RepID=UPI00191E106A|nr:hypothetical protein [Aeromonas veronii]MBL0489575.1 hypothetical protein [Aeromonas veronii]
MLGSTLEVQQQEAQHREQVINWVCEGAASLVVNQREPRPVAMRKTMDVLLNHESMGDMTSPSEATQNEMPSSFQIKRVAEELRPLATKAVDAFYESSGRYD